MVSSYLGDFQIRFEAAVAMIQSVHNIGVIVPDEARAAMAQLTTMFPGSSTAEQAQGALNRLDAVKNYVMVWQVAGPYWENGKGFREHLDIPFAPESSDGGGAVWKILPGTPQRDKPWLLDLAPLMGGEHRAGYLRTKVYSPVSQEAELVCGSDDCIKIWLNSSVVHSFREGRRCIPDSDVVTVSLQEGWNTVMLKVVNDDSTWEASFLIRSLSGTPIEGLRVSLD